MPVLNIYENNTISLSLPINLASRTVFRFYTANNDGNNQPLTGFTSAVFVIYPENYDVIEIPMVIQANGDVILYISPNYWSLGPSINDCAIFIDNDYVPFLSGTVSFGTVIQPNQAFAVMNASRNAVLINGTQYENPQYVNGISVEYDVSTDEEGITTVSQEIGTITQEMIYSAVKDILQAGDGINIIPDNLYTTLTIELE